MKLSSHEMRNLRKFWVTEWFPVVLMSLFIGLAFSYWLLTSGYVGSKSIWVFLSSAVIPAVIVVFTYPYQRTHKR